MEDVRTEMSNITGEILELTIANVRKTNEIKSACMSYLCYTLCDD